MQQFMDDQPAHYREPYDKVYAGFDGLPGVKRSRPATVTTSLPMVGDSTTYVIESLRGDRGLVVFLQIVDQEGRARLVLPDKVVRTILRQSERLTTRATPASRKRQARSRTLTRKRALDHEKGRHEGTRTDGKPKRVDACAACKA